MSLPDADKLLVFTDDTGSIKEGEAPEDGKLYSRKDKGWVLTTDAFDEILTSKNTGQVLVSENTGNVLITG